MSVIVAIKKEGVVYVGADSQVSYGGSKLSLKNPNNFKIWPVRGVEGCLMGCVGSFRDACVLRTLENVVTREAIIDDKVDYSYVVNVIEPLIRQTLVDHKFVMDNDPYGTMESEFLFIYKDKLYTIGAGSVIEHDDYVALGSGESEAFGSLNSTESEKDPAMRIVKAIKASVGHGLYVGYPIILTTSTDNTRFIIVDEKMTEKLVTSVKKQKKEKGASAMKKGKKEVDKKAQSKKNE